MGQEEKDEQVEHRGFFTAVKILCMIGKFIHIIHVYESTEYATSVVNSNANYGLQVIMMCQCRFTNCHKCPTLVGDAGNGGGCAYVGAVSIWEISIPSTQFCSEPKNAQLRTSDV